jgi:hypothetical protein
MQMKTSLLLLSLSVPFLGACSHTLIPNTEVEDSGENRKVVTFCERYRHAVEDKDVPGLLSLASDRYYEDGGNANVEDDIDYAGLKDYLANTYQKTKNVRYEIRYRKVTFTEKREVHVDYTYTASYRLPGVKSDEWRHMVADNRLVLIPAGEGYKIVSGM